MPESRKPTSDLSDLAIDEPVVVTKDKEEESTPEVPEKYAGKSLDEVIAMHQNAESALGRQGSELGELRKHADMLLQADIAAREATNRSSTEETSAGVEWDYDNPANSVREIVTRAVKDQLDGVNKAVAGLGQQQGLKDLQAAHPDHLDIARDESFQKWVAASNVRKELYVRGDRGDFDAANELLSTFKQLKSVKSPSAEDKTENEAGLKDAVLESAGGTATARKSSGAPKFRAMDLQELKIKNPAKYWQMLPEIRKAYQEGRVLR